MKRYRFLVFGAHPDDCDLFFGASAIQLIRAGHTVKFVSATDGCCGHHRIPPEELAPRRYRETQAAAKVAGLAEYQVLDHVDGSLEATLEFRWEILKIIRNFAPDVVLSPRIFDYHPDHRALGQAVQDASYLCTVPHCCPEVPMPEDWHPVFACVYDPFTLPYPFMPDAAMPVDPVLDGKLEMLCCHESQFFEWLPFDWNIHDIDFSKLDLAGRKKFIQETFMRKSHDAPAANCGRKVLQEMYGETGKNVQYAEVFMLVSQLHDTMERQKFQNFFLGI